MSKRSTIGYSLLFSIIIIAANYTVQFSINEWLTYGALLFPFTFLITDILSEKYSKAEVLKVVKIGILIAIVPTILVSDWRIALASIATFYVVQQLDVHIFHALKERFQSQWFLRNNLSTITSQFFDTVIFFTLAFAFVLPADVIIKLIIGDYIVKVVLALADTPLFYLFAIRAKNALLKKRGAQI